jgi:hypothetical protein
MDSQFDALDIPADKRVDVSNLVDRRAKMESAKWDAYALDLGLNQNQLDGLKIHCSVISTCGSKAKNSLARSPRSKRWV